jgi:hypothetical protein
MAAREERTRRMMDYSTELLAPYFQITRQAWHAN